MSSKSIYTSSKILPYVYILIHKDTGQFYIGSRANKNQSLPSHIDILDYKSSSKEVKKLGFGNFNVTIVAEFFNGTDAYDFEQELIYSNFNNKLILNKHHRYKCNGRFNFSGHRHSDDARLNISIKNKGKPKPIEFSEKLRKRNLGRIASEKARRNMSNAQKNRTLNKYNGIRTMHKMNISPILYQIYNTKTDEYYIGRRYDILKKYGKTLRSIIERVTKRTYSGWILLREIEYPII